MPKKVKGVPPSGKGKRVKTGPMTRKTRAFSKKIGKSRMK